MTVAPEPLPPLPKPAWPRLAWPAWLTMRRAIELACRAGYASRGFVYLSIGAIALMAALRLTPHARGAQGALFEAWAGWPPAIILLWITGLGLYAFTGWRVLQAVFDVDGQGTGMGAIGSRAGQALSGLIYLVLAISVFGLVDAFEDLREADDQAATRDTVATVLALPFGSWLVIAAGVFMLAAGAGNITQAALRSFDSKLDCDAVIGRWCGWLGRAGYLARGVAFLPAGLFMVSAGLHARASEARGIGGALEALKRYPMGHLWLGLVAVGLIAFGLYGFVEARFRRMGRLDAR